MYLFKSSPATIAEGHIGIVEIVLSIEWTGRAYHRTSTDDKKISCT